MIREGAVGGIDEDSLISRCVSRDRGAWEAFLAEHGRFLRAEARRRLFRYMGRADEADVDDAFQEVVCQLMKDGARTLAQFRMESSVSTWLACVVRSVCRQIVAHRRSGARVPLRVVRPSLAEDDFPPEGLIDALSRLPARDRRILRLFFYEGRKYREIAGLLRISVNSVGPLLNRALRAAGRLLRK